LTARPSKIMLVESDPRLLEMLVDSVTRRFDAQVTCAAAAEAALDVELFEPHDLFVSRVDLPGIDGIELAERVLSVRRRPFILMADHPTLAQAVGGLRAGALDFFAKPFDLGQLLTAMDRGLYAYREARQQQQRQRQLRGLVRRVIRQRRDLNERVDLICRDLVGAHRRLMARVLQTEA